MTQCRLKVITRISPLHRPFSITIVIAVAAIFITIVTIAVSASLLIKTSVLVVEFEA